MTIEGAIAYGKRVIGLGLNDETQAFCELAIEALQERKTGKWEWVQYDANPEIGNFHCSKCRFIPATFNLAKRHLNYCPKCGAKMEVDG